MENIFNLFVLPSTDILVRIFLSIILGFALGLERELTNKWAGLRTNMLVCLGSCLFTLLSIYGFSTAISLYPLGDPSRVAAQVITGIGFIGGGTVLRHGLTVSGLTTAATLWVVASIGMACGCGQLAVATVTTVVAVAVLVLIRLFEVQVMPKNLKNMRLVAINIICPTGSASDIEKQLFTLFNSIQDFSKRSDEHNQGLTKIAIKAIVNERHTIASVQEKLGTIPCVNSISVKEISD